ncbi:MAG: D-TA family PLP-dependent enzyme [Verrucomicrobiales bacterium]|nr:D-TA family PLP-dependent enzyme [Verrucomicrobiales bacterium]
MWPAVSNADLLPTPALLIDPERIDENLRRMVEMAGSPERLRPHIKTHKLPQVIHRQLDLGITRFKCSTIAEAEMAALSGAPDILLAGQPLGANAVRFAQLHSRFPGTRFSALVDDAAACAFLGEVAAGAGQTFELFADLDVGQHRTGIAPDERALALCRTIAEHPFLLPAGLHAYDGHLHQTDVAERTAACDAAFAPVAELKRALEAEGFEVPEIVAGGTPTFPMHARRAGVQCSPGTCVLWDAGYGVNLPDLPFLHAAVLLARVVSKPAPDRLCLDLGHKAVASEMAPPRVVFPDISDAAPLIHNEEHLVIRTARAADFSVGSLVYGIPWHICPTVALHSEVWVVRDGAAAEPWPVVGRARRISI